MIEIKMIITIKFIFCRLNILYFKKRYGCVIVSYEHVKRIWYKTNLSTIFVT